MGKFIGNQKYIDQLVSYYSAKNSIAEANKKYIMLCPQDKVLWNNQHGNPPLCCKILETWDINYHIWDIKEELWDVYYYL